MTCNLYVVASATGFHTYSGVVVVMADVGEIDVGIAGIWPAIETSIWRGALQGPVPNAFVARTNQL